MLLWNLLTEAAEGGADASGESGGLDFGGLIMVGVLLVAIIGLFVWQTVSNKKKQKEAQNMVDSLKIGDRVKTIGGICGFVAQINDGENTFVLETGLEGSKSYIKFDKGAIYQTAPAQGNAVEAPAETKKEAEPVEEKVAPAEESAEPAKEEKPKRTRKKKNPEETL